MNLADQIKAIAEFDGWTNVHNIPYRFTANEERLPCGWFGNPNTGVYPEQAIPPYLSSLDAIVPLTEKLSDDEFETYWGTLCDMLVVIETAKASNKYVTNATAAQRCEALLRTIGKWRDE